MKSCRPVEGVRFSASIVGPDIAICSAAHPMQRVQLKWEPFEGGFLSPQQQDLFVFAKALYIIDTLVDGVAAAGTRCEVSLPLANGPALLEALQTSGLSDLINRVTDKTWSFTTEVQPVPWLSTRQLISEHPPCTGVLYSGGLDGFVGFENVLAWGGTEKDSVFGVHINTQSQAKSWASRTFGSRSRPLLSVPLNRTGRSGSEVGVSKYARTRPIAFILLACARMMAAPQLTVVVAENQIGAFNYNYFPGEPRAYRSTALRPASLKVVWKFLRAYCPSEVELVNPFGLMLKSQMLGQLTPEQVAHSYQTVSCHRSDRGTAHDNCGMCSSCLLRRQSYIAAGLVDETGYDDARSRSNVKEMHAYFAHAKKIERVAAVGDAPRAWLERLYPGIVGSELRSVACTPENLGEIIRTVTENVLAHAAEALVLQRRLDA